MKLYRMKKDGVEYGSYRLYVPASQGGPRNQNLATSDPIEAQRRAEAYIARLEAANAIHAADSSVESGAGLDGGANSAPTVKVDPGSLIGEWAKSQAEDSEPEAPEASTPEEPAADYMPPEPEAPEAGGVKPSQSPALMRTLSIVAVRLNVAAIAMSIQAFGRQPRHEPGDDDTDLLQTAWEEQLKIWFADTEMAPWVVIVAASAALGLTMYADSDVIEEPVSSVPGGSAEQAA